MEGVGGTEGRGGKGGECEEQRVRVERQRGGVRGAEREEEGQRGGVGRTDGRGGRGKGEG